MKKFNSNYILIGIFVLVLIGLVLVINNKQDNTINTKYRIVNNATTFFTIEGCVNRYINSLSKSEVDNLMILIDDEYIEKHNLNKENILSHLGQKKVFYTFMAKKIYSEVSKTDYINYYIYGLLSEEKLNEADYGNDYYIKVKVQKSNNLFSIIPITEKEYKEIENGFYKRK